MATHELFTSSSWTQPHPILSAVQHIRRMRGGSQAHLLRVDDGNLYITKFQNNPQHVRVLANEFMATRLARFLGLPVPDVEIIAVPDWLIEETPGLRIEIASRLVRCASGLQLGIRYAADLWQDRISDHLADPKFEFVKNKQDFWRILVFDKWLGNCDGRQAVFTRRSDQREYDATFIDHGYCFNGSEWTFPDLPLHGVYHRNFVYSGVTGWDSFEPTFPLAENFDPQVLWKIAMQIPEEWYESDRAALARLIESLDERRPFIPGLIVNFGKSARRPFSNWSLFQKLQK